MPANILAYTNIFASIRLNTSGIILPVLHGCLKPSGIVSPVLHGCLSHSTTVPAVLHGCLKSSGTVSAVLHRLLKPSGTVSAVLQGRRKASATVSARSPTCREPSSRTALAASGFGRGRTAAAIAPGAPGHWFRLLSGGCKRAGRVVPLVTGCLSSRQ